MADGSTHEETVITIEDDEPGPVNSGSSAGVSSAGEMRKQATSGRTSLFITVKTWEFSDWIWGNHNGALQRSVILGFSTAFTSRSSCVVAAVHRSIRRVRYG